MAKYRKKPLVVKAEQFLVDELPWPDGVYKEHQFHEGPHYAGCMYYMLSTSLTEADRNVSPGDYIVTEAHGSYPCNAEVFKDLFDGICDPEEKKTA